MKFRRSGLFAINPQAFFTLEIGGPALVYERPFDVDGAAAVVYIRGALCHHKDKPDLDSYDDIKCRMQAAFDSECQAVLMCIDSLGGEVSGVFDLAVWIRQTATARNKRLLAYVEGQAASAAYALACVADEIGTSITGFCGSIGVINAICDQTAADAAMGVKFVFATSGTLKGAGNPHMGVTDAAVESLQHQVDDLANVFYNHVAAHRPLSAASVAAFEAGLFFGTGAVSSRLADRVCSWSDMVLAANQTPQPKGTTMGKYADARKELAAKMLVDGDDEDKAAAKRMLAADDEVEDVDKKKESEASAEDEKKDEMKAADEDKEKAAAESEKKDAEMKAAAAATTFELARELHAIKAQMAAEKASIERASLLASRPDFDAKTLAWLATLPVAQVKAACETFPKIVVNPAAASQVAGARGDVNAAVDADTAYVRSIMRDTPEYTGVRQVGGGVEFGAMTKEQARELLAKGAK